MQLLPFKGILFLVVYKISGHVLEHAVVPFDAILLGSGLVTLDKMLVSSSSLILNVKNAVHSQSNYGSNTP